MAFSIQYDGHFYGYSAKFVEQCSNLNKYTVKEMSVLKVYCK